MPNPAHIRPGRPTDRDALFEICLKTADSGQDATAFYSDPEYPGQVWAVPYLELEPAHCFVVDADGRAVGFVVAAPDTAAFEARLEQAWWPALRRRYADRVPVRKLDGRVLDMRRVPERHAAELVSAYPAHLHINLLPPFQSGGWGRRLIAAELDSLRRAAVPAVHLGVSPSNAKALGFYAHVGFERIPGPQDGVWFGMRL